MKYIMCIIISSLVVFLMSIFWNLSDFKESKKITPYYRTFLIDGGTFEIGTQVIISENRKFSSKIINIYFNDSFEYINTNVIGQSYFKEGYNSVLWISHIPTNPAEKAVLAHEISHIVMFTLNYVGITGVDSNTEIYAYQTSYLTRKIYEHLDSMTLKLE